MAMMRMPAGVDGGGSFEFENISSQFSGSSKTITSGEAGNLVLSVNYSAGTVPKVYLDGVAQTVAGTSNKTNVYALNNVEVGQVLSWDTLDTFVCLRQV